MAKTSKIILGLAAGAALLALWGVGFGASVNTAHAQTTSTATLIVRKVVVNSATSNFLPTDFLLGIASASTTTSTIIHGNASGTAVTVKPGAYTVVEASTNGITATMSADCSGTIAAGETKTCTVTNTVAAGAATTTLPNTGAGNPVVPVALMLALISGGTLAYFGFRKFTV